MLQPRGASFTALALLLLACGDDEQATGGAGGSSAPGGSAGDSPGGASATGAGGTGGDASTGGGDLITPTDAADNPDSYEDADDWNYPSDNYFVCGTLKNASAQLRYADFALISEQGHYAVTDDLSSDECGAGRVRFDLHEILYTTSGRLLFHKGGQGYDDTTTPYGHLWIADLESPAPSPQVSGEPPEYGTPSKIPGTDQWDYDKRNGRGCEPTGELDSLTAPAPQTRSGG